MSRRHGGFTLIEVVITVLIVSVLSATVLPRVLTPGTLTLSSQGQALAELIRRTQATAMVRQQRTRLDLAAGAGQATLAACSASQVCLGDSSLQLQQGVVAVVSSGANPLYFNSMGLPVDAAGVPLRTATVYSVSHTTANGQRGSVTVSVAPLSGRVQVQ